MQTSTSGVLDVVTNGSPLQHSTCVVAVRGSHLLVFNCSLSSSSLLTFAGFGMWLHFPQRGCLWEPSSPFDKARSSPTLSLGLEVLHVIPLCTK